MTVWRRDSRRFAGVTPATLKGFNVGAAPGGVSLAISDAPLLVVKFGSGNDEVVALVA